MSAASAPTIFRGGIGIHFVSQADLNGALGTNEVAGIVPQTRWNNTQPIRNWTRPAGGKATQRGKIQMVVVIVRNQHEVDRRQERRGHRAVLRHSQLHHVGRRARAAGDGENGGEGEEIAAIIVAAGDLTEAALVAHCRVRLSPDKRPRRFVFVTELPRTSNGNVSRAKLRERLEASV